MNLFTLQKKVKSDIEDVAEFWLKNGFDHEHGGVYTCLDRKGNVYSTDKSVWMQGRCGWTFSRLCNLYGMRNQWIEFADSCINFIDKYCKNRTAGDRMYFSVTGDGKPLRQRRYSFSEAFYVMACAEYYKATGDIARLYEARKYYELIYKLNNKLIDDPVGLPPKTDIETRSGRALSPTMIYLNMSRVMYDCDPDNAELYLKRASESADIILKYHFKPELEVTLENVGPNGEFYRDYTDGRHINPGHAIECAWFLMDHADLTHDDDMMGKAVKMMEFAVKKGWDEEYGGLLYFSDALGLPRETCEHDMKLWWPHNELAIASLMAYMHSGSQEHLKLFEKNCDYAFKVFGDEEYGEWYGYLRRDGKPTEPTTKGTLYKGPFHLPRMLMMLDGMLDRILSGGGDT